MKNWSRLLIAVACFTAPGWTSTSGLAGTRSTATFSQTAQSKVVLTFISYLRDGEFAKARGLLQNDAKARYGTDASMRALRDRFENLADGAGTPEINIRTFLQPILKPDTLPFSNHSYKTEVMGRTATDAPILDALVDCKNVILLEALGAPDMGCVIGNISAAHANSTQESVQVRAAHYEKQLGDDVLGAPQAVGHANALEAGGAQNR